MRFNPIEQSRTDAIHALKQNGMSAKMIGKMFNLTPSRVNQILNNVDRSSNMRLKKREAAFARLNALNGKNLLANGMSRLRLSVLAETSSEIVTAWLAS